MEEIKTLEDITFDGEESSCGLAHAHIVSLRNEAIKHIKDLERSKFENDEFTYPIYDGKINWIKNFFNITNEDLLKWKKRNEIGSRK